MHGRHLWNTCCKGGYIVINMLQPILELCVVIPGVILAYFPVKSGLKHPIRQIMIWLLPLLLLLLYKADLYHTGTCPDPVSHNFSLYKNAPDLSVEIRNGSIVYLCCICLY